MGKDKNNAAMKHIITADYNGQKIERTAFSGQQAFTIINTLAREGCTNIGMKEEPT